MSRRPALLVRAALGLALLSAGLVALPASAASVRIAGPSPYGVVRFGQQVQVELTGPCSTTRSKVLVRFGRTVVQREDAGAASLIGNILWFILAGWWLALGHLITSIALAITIIGIPFAWANLKLIPVSIMPLGRKIVSSDESFAYGRSTQPAPAQY